MKKIMTSSIYGKMKEEPKVKCPDCSGDGKETCHNPDHGLINNILSFHNDIGRLGCPLCGHHPQGKVKNGGDCETCNGKGIVDREIAETFIKDMEYDIELIEVK